LAKASPTISPPLTLQAMTSGSAVQTAPSTNRGGAQTTVNFESFVRALAIDRAQHAIARVLNGDAQHMFVPTSCHRAQNSIGASRPARNAHTGVE
jgi:hypothetical protein